jgi:hypothetical protein
MMMATELTQTEHLLTIPQTQSTSKYSSSIQVRKSTILLPILSYLQKKKKK